MHACMYMYMYMYMNMYQYRYQYLLDLCIHRHIRTDTFLVSEPVVGRSMFHSGRGHNMACVFQDC